MNESGIFMNGLDLVDTEKILRRRNKKYLAILLEDLEIILPKDDERFTKIRKLILDNFNDYTNSVIRLVAGDIIEGDSGKE